jgi:hypothetical protein
LIFLWYVISACFSDFWPVLVPGERALSPPSSDTGAPILERALILQQPFAGRRYPIVDMLAKNDVRRGSFAKGALALAGAETNAALPRIFLFGDVPFKEQRSILIAVLGRPAIFFALHLSAPPRWGDRERFGKAGKSSNSGK